ncbi:MAG: class I SAM-dependent RNA methyltransferase, partial [Planctomycetota bacterium]
MKLELLATTAFGLEALARRELEALNFEARTSEPGRISFHGDASAICTANLWLRTAERVLVVIGRFEATDFGQLFDRTRELPWEEWVGAQDAFPVRGRSVKSQLSSVPACQRIVKKAIVDRLMEAHGTDRLEESGPARTIEVALLEDRVTLTIDTTGVGLHKRGYRSLVGAAPLRETLAAALVQLSFWHDDRPLVDPFCGSGTIPIEAALIGTNRAPGLARTFAAQDWPNVPESLWEAARTDARAQLRPLQSQIVGYDADEEALSLARRHAQQAGVADLVRFERQEFEQLESDLDYGVLIANPPYGERVGEQKEVAALYQRFPIVLGRLPTWSHFIFTAMEEFERRVGRGADRRRKLFNGPLQCTYYQVHGPRRGKGAQLPAAGRGLPEVAAQPS